MCSDNIMGKVISTGRRYRVFWKTLTRNAQILSEENNQILLGPI